LDFLFKHQDELDDKDEARDSDLKSDLLIFEGVKLEGDRRRYGVGLFRALQMN